MTASANRLFLNYKEQIIEILLYCYFRHAICLQRMGRKLRNPNLSFGSSKKDLFA